MTSPTASGLEGLHAEIDRRIAGLDQRSAHVQRELGSLRAELEAWLEELEAAQHRGSPNDLFSIAGRLLRARIREVQGIEGSYFENKRFLASNAQAWAIHFSNIRLGLTTFLVSVSWGMVGLQWQEYHGALACSAFFVWALAVALFGAFTWRTFKKEELERKNLKALLVGKGDQGPVSWDPLCNGAALSSAVIAAALIAFWPEPGCGGTLVIMLFLAAIGVSLGAAMVKSKRAGDAAGRYVPDMAVILATIAFGFLLQAWKREVASDFIYRVETTPAGGITIRPSASPAAGSLEKAPPGSIDISAEALDRLHAK